MRQRTGEERHLKGWAGPYPSGGSSQRQHGRHAVRSGEAEQTVADAGEAVHQAGRLDAAAGSATRSVPFDAGEHGGGVALDIREIGAAELPRGLEEDVEIPQVAVAEAVALPKTAVGGEAQSVFQLAFQRCALRPASRQ